MKRKGLFTWADERRYEGGYKDDKKKGGGGCKTSKIYIFNFKYFLFNFQFYVISIIENCIIK